MTQSTFRGPGLAGVAEEASTLVATFRAYPR